jgi:lipoate-protein ligase A
MAADRLLLDWACQGPSRLVFRTYAWERPTLSLGRSEPFPEGWDEGAIARAGVEVARRPTGGNAVLHVEEVTFALAASLPGPWGLTPRGFANAAAEALAETLRVCGLEGARLEKGLVQGADRGTLCFARSAPGEVSAHGYKVAGIASRFDRGGALCHASVPLTALSRSIVRFRRDAGVDGAALDANARSVGELIGDYDAAAIGNELARSIAERFGVELVDTSFEELGIDACEPVSSR